MKGTLVAFVMKLAGLGGLWEKINGIKTYITGAAAILTGFGGMLMAAAAEASRFVASVHGFSDMFNFVQDLFKNPDAPAKEFALAWLAVLAGFKIISTKHSEDKKHAELLAATMLSPAVSTATATATVPIVTEVLPKA